MKTLTAAAALLAFATAPAWAGDERWPDIKEMLFEDREILDGTEVIALDAPYRAHNAAIVPMGIQSLLGPEDGRHIERVHLVIDENPAPVAGVFHMGPQLYDADITTRVRIDQYTDVRAIAETSDGQLYMVSAFVKAAGGCSAPSVADHEAAMATIGQMQLKSTIPEDIGGPQSVKFMVRHPNYSGLQKDPITQYWIPPDYVDTITFALDGEEVLRVEADISIAEDPTFTFNLSPEVSGELSVSIHDTEDRAFEDSWTVGPAS